MRKITLTLLVLTILSSLAIGQSQSITAGQNLRAVLNDKLNETYSIGGEEGVYSSDFSKNPFIFKEWQYARIEFRDGKVVDSLMINYDDKQKVLLVTLVQATNPFTINTKQVTQFTFYNNPAKPYLGKDNNEFEDVDRPYSFYQRLYGNEDAAGYTVLKGYVKKFRDAEDQVTYGSVSTPEGKFDLYPRYYIKQGDGKFKRLTLGKKAIQNLIGKGKMKEAQKLLKSKKLKWGDEDALVTVIENYL